MSAEVLSTVAKDFCENAPHKEQPYAKRNWGGTLHSLCSYHGKLKPSIAHFLVKNFTSEGDRVLDPLAGVGTIPLEARRLGRIGIANDLSAVAATVSAAKLLPVAADQVQDRLIALNQAVEASPPLATLTSDVDVSFGLNGPISSYYHPDTLREILAARRWFLEQKTEGGSADALLMTCLLHILHGNRPYALSRTSHPVTPFKPSGPVEYRGLSDRLATRVQTVLPLLLDLDAQGAPGLSTQCDFADLELQPVDAVVTSPPFAKSVRFWSMNWLRLWFAGWDPIDFAVEPKRYLEHLQRADLDIYATFAAQAYRWLRPGGSLILHLGETDKVNMALSMAPLIRDAGFTIAHVGRECVRATESHGLTDKGATVAHWYLFAIKD